MISIFNCCVKATHQQDSRWSLVVCICATLCQVLVVGILRSFGVLFPVLMAEFETSRERTAWIGSLALSLTLFAAPVVGRLSQKFSCRLGVFIGGLLYITGLTATSFVNDIEVMFFTFSVLTGLGSSFCRTSCFLMVAKYFNKKRSFATGSVTMGPSLGLFIWGPVTQVLLDSVGWRNTVRVMALSCTLVLVLAIPFNPNVEEKDTISEDSCEEVTEPNYQDGDDGTRRAKIQTGNKKFKILDFSVWKIPQYCFLVASFTLMSMCRFIPSIHLVKYSEELNIPADKASHFYMFLGISSGAARLLIGRLCDVKWVNIRYINQLGIALAGLATSLLPLAKSYVSVALYTAVFGFSDGAFITSQNIILLSIVGPDRRDAAFGFGCMLCSFALAAGPPLAGLIADKLASYEFAFYAAGSMMLLSGTVQFFLFCFKATASETKREELNERMVTDSEGMGEKGQYKENDHKEYLSGLYIDSSLTKNCKISASVESMQLL